MEDIILRTTTAKSVIHCGAGAFERYAPAYRDKQIYIVTDSNVFALYRHLLWQTFGNDFPINIFPAGESSKNFRNLNAILDGMLKAGMRRNCYVLAFGGGVIGDLAGLAASLYMRGVNLVQIPTSLLAQIDSSVGGKTAIDLNGVKNTVGTFYQPNEVIIDPVFLQTLTAKELRCGLGEIIKYGALNAQIFDKLFANINDLFSEEFLKDIIYDCVKYKAEVVSRDERDVSGERKALNFAHTTGHAFELFYRKKSHGEFVMIGAYYELYIAQKLGICGGQYAKELQNLILAVIKKAPYLSGVEQAAELALHDKKNESKEISLILPKDKGEWTEVNLPLEEYANLLKECAEKL